MEIVKNGELLESQILEDARAKARRLLDAADRECAALRAHGEAAWREEERRLGETRSSRLETLRRELAESLPLDFRRARLAFLQQAVDKALAGLFSRMSAGDVSRIITRHLSRAASAFAGKHVTVWHAGTDQSQAREIVQQGLPGAVVDEVKELAAEEAAAAVKGVIVVSTDGSRRCRATLGELTQNLMEDHREELVTALYGKDAET